MAIKKKISTDELTFDVEVDGKKIGKITPADGLPETTLKETKAKVIAKDGVIYLTQKDAINVLAKKKMKWSKEHFCYVSEEYMDDLVSKPERDIFEKPEDIDFAEVQKVLESPKYKENLTFELTQTVTLMTFKTLFGNAEGERMDFINRHFINERLRLIRPTKNKSFIFHSADYDSYVDLDWEECRQLLKDFGKTVKAYVDKETASENKRKGEIKRRKQVEDEEKELEQIVVQTQREENGFGSWS